MKTIFQVYPTIKEKILEDNKDLVTLALDISINAGKVEMALISDADKVKWYLRPLMIDLIALYRFVEAEGLKDNFFNDYKTKPIKVSEDYKKTISYPVSLVMANIKSFIEADEVKLETLNIKISIMSLFQHLNAGAAVTGMSLAELLEGPKNA